MTSLSYILAVASGPVVTAVAVGAPARDEEQARLVKGTWPFPTQVTHQCSVHSVFDNRIEFPECDARLARCDLPVDRRPARVALLQRAHPPPQGRQVTDRAREATALADADLDLGLVEPAAVLGMGWNFRRDKIRRMLSHNILVRLSRDRDEDRLLSAPLDACSRAYFNTLPRFYNHRDGGWEDQVIDFAASTHISLYGVEVAIMPKGELLAYKALLDRDVDHLDIEQMTAVS